MKGFKGITGLSLILALLMLVIVPGGCLLRAPTYTLTLHRNNDSWGGVSGGGTFRVGQAVRIDATPFQGYLFF